MLPNCPAFERQNLGGDAAALIARSDPAPQSGQRGVAKYPDSSLNSNPHTASREQLRTQIAGPPLRKRFASSVR